MFRTLTLLIVLPCMLGAQQFAPRRVTGPVPAGVVARATVEHNLDVQSTLRPALPPLSAIDSASQRPLLRYTLTGMSVGAIAGVLGGAIGSRYVGCGCSDTEKTVGFALWFGAIGAAAGAILGAVISFASDHAP